MVIVNHEAEVAVLGAVLLDGTLFKDLELSVEHFYYPNHKLIFQAMKTAADRGEFIDIVVVSTHLGNNLNKVGGTSYLLKLAQSVATTANIKHHESLIFAAYRTRVAKNLAIQFAKNPSDEHIPSLIRKLSTCSEIGVKKDEKSTKDLLVDLSQEIFEDKELHSYFTSYHDLDKLTGGWQKGDLIIIAARPSVGKTAFALNLAANHCKNGGSTSIFSLEMGNKQLLRRLISKEGQINGRKWLKASFTEEDYEGILDAIGKISTWDIHLYDRKRTITEIRYALRRQIHENPDSKHLVIIDYLQLITPTGKYDRHEISIGEITRELKLLAIELDIPIILLSQLTRGVEARQNKRPMMSDLRGSGNIEQDADVIIFLYREDYYRREMEKEDTVEVIISKHRNGPTGMVELTFQKEYGLFQ
jgi:replicative DNA helicase